MELEFNKEKLQKVVNDFYNATGVGIIIVNDASVPLVSRPVKNSYCDFIRRTDSGNRKCHESDRCLLEKCKSSKQVEMGICHGGLITIAAPIICDDITVAYVMLYSLRQGPFSNVAEKFNNLPSDTTKMEEYYYKIEEYDAIKYESISSIAVMLAKYVILEDMITFNLNSNFERAKEYINHNLDNKLSIQEISKNTHISKSALYKAFHLTLNCTINDYITAQRIKKASALLAKTDMTLDEIALATGFSNADYLGRVFKKMKGQSPSKYRKMYADSSNR